MKASHPDYPEVLHLLTLLCVLANRHMHPEAAELPEAEAAAMKEQVREDLRVLLED